MQSILGLRLSHLAPVGGPTQLLGALPYEAAYLLGGCAATAMLQAFMQGGRFVTSPELPNGHEARIG